VYICNYTGRIQPARTPTCLAVVWHWEEGEGAALPEMRRTFVVVNCTQLANSLDANARIKPFSIFLDVSNSGEGVTVEEDEEMVNGSTPIYRRYTAYVSSLQRLVISHANVTYSNVHQANLISILYGIICSVSHSVLRFRQTAGPKSLRGNTQLYRRTK
jgi:hypothetical protein